MRACERVPAPQRSAETPFFEGTIDQHDVLGFAVAAAT